jgi:cell division protein FtsL
MRLINFVALGVLLGLVFLIYELKFETRRLESRAAELSKSIEDEKDNLAVMRAEWSLVSSPGRVEQMAGKLLGLQPVKPEQIVPFQEIASHETRRAAFRSASPGASGGNRNSPVIDPFASETTGAISPPGVIAQRDDIGALINSLERRAEDDRPTR